MEGSQGNRSVYRQRGKSGLPTSRVPWENANSIKGGASPWIVPQKITALASRPAVRVKMCGKSARLYTAMYTVGKPYPEQDKIGAFGRLFRFKRAGMSHR